MSCLAPPTKFPEGERAAAFTSVVLLASKQHLLMLLLWLEEQFKSPPCTYNNKKDIILGETVQHKRSPRFLPKTL